MGWLDILAQSNPSAVARNSENEDIQNALRRAQANQLVQEALSRSEMLPYEIESKQAASQYNRALASKMSQPQVSNEERNAKAEELRRSSQLARTVPLLERMGMQLNDQTAPQLFQELQSKLGELPPEVAQYFGTPDKMSMSRELLDAAARYAREQHPEMAKNLRTQTQQEGLTARNTASIESRERIATDRANLLKDISAEKSKGTSGNLKYLAEDYQRQADAYRMAGDIEKAAMYYDMASRAASLAAMKSPAASKEDVSLSGMGIQTTSPIAPNANTPDIAVEIVRDPKTGKLIRK